MFGFSKKKEKVGTCPPPDGIAELILCVFDEKHKLRYHFSSTLDKQQLPERFQILNHTETALNSMVLKEALESKKPASLAFSLGNGERRFLYVLPYARKKNRLNFACMQVAPVRPDSERGGAVPSCELAEDRLCLLLTDDRGLIVSVGSKVPEAFGYFPEHMIGKNLSDLFTKGDLSMINSCSPDTNESIQSCVFRCQDGSKRDVDVKKYSLPDHHFLLGVSDVMRQDYKEEITQASSRERRRIGQDLHDSIGQVLTGISLLSRSLANSLKRAGHPGDEDAVQISELADDASNQIRQISRGLMPSEIVQRGLKASLEELARSTTESCGLVCEARFDDVHDFSDGAVETHLFRIAQEAVNNAVRHAGASRIELIVGSRNGMPQLEIRDNGLWKECLDSSGGIGMKTMHYRAAAIGGQLSIGPSEEGGTQVICCLEVDDLVETEV